MPTFANPMRNMRRVALCKLGCKIFLVARLCNEVFFHLHTCHGEKGIYVFKNLVHEKLVLELFCLHSTQVWWKRNKDLWVLANLMYRDWVLVLVFLYLHKCDGEGELCSWSLMHEIGVLELEVWSKRSSKQPLGLKKKKSQWLSQFNY